jgi:large subunit ribosomal protein L6
MSRIGKKSVPVPSGVNVALKNEVITISGPKGSLDLSLRPEVAVEHADDLLTVTAKGTDRISRSMHGLTRTLLSNMVAGVQNPFKKSLEITGVGYRAEMQGKAIKLQVGLSHDVIHPIPDGVTCTIDKQTTVHLESIDKALVGQVAAALRAYRPCEPYKGKGVKYVGERIRRKEGKTGAA